VPQIAEHLRQRLGFAGIALEHSRAAHKAAAIEHQSKVTSAQSDRFSFERPWVAFALPAQWPSKYVLVKSYSVTVSSRAKRLRTLANR